MKPLSSIPKKILRDVKAVFFDIDDTFSGGHGLPCISAEAYEALWRLHHAKIHAIPVTGRPAGWCDMIARMWPVSAVVGENGAFYAYIDDSKKPARLSKKYLESASTRKANAKKLAALRRAVERRFKGVKTASDQGFREFDLAFDYCEDVPRWPQARVHELIDFCKAQGAVAKLSSIHVNTWFGRYDKWTCVQRLLKDGIFRIDRDISRIAYIGDSPNDEPFFERLPLTAGVANVRKFLGGMQYPPAYITTAEAGLGFAEFAETLLKSRP